MNEPSTKIPSVKSKIKGKFKNEAEFLASEKQRFDEVFGNVNWRAVKNTQP